MSGPKDTRGVGARGVVREIDEQLGRLDREEKALMAERGGCSRRRPRWPERRASAHRAASAPLRMTSPPISASTQAPCPRRSRGRWVSP